MRNLIDIKTKHGTSFGLMIYFILFASLCSGQDMGLEVRSCLDQTPIEKAYILNDKTGKVLGYSNKEGIIYLSGNDLKWPLHLHVYKMSALDTSVVVTRGETTFCLKPKSHQLNQFDVISEKEDIAESFRQYLDKTIAVLKDADTTHYFSFTWDYMLPDSNWSMNIEGVLKVPFKSYSKSYSGGYSSSFCSFEMTVDSGLYNSTFLKANDLNDIGDFLSTGDNLRKRSVYRKKISDETVLKKVVGSDSTSFVYSSPIKKDWKLFSGYPLFDKDSILVQNEFEYLLIDTLGKQKTDFVYLKESGRLKYTLIDGELVLSSIELDDNIRSKTGIISIVKFNSYLLRDSVPECEEISVMKHFHKEDLEELERLKGYDVVIE